MFFKVFLINILLCCLRVSVSVFKYWIYLFFLVVSLLKIFIFIDGVVDYLLSVFLRMWILKNVCCFFVWNKFIKLFSFMLYIVKDLDVLKVVNIWMCGFSCLNVKKLFLVFLKFLGL